MNPRHPLSWEVCNLSSLRTNATFNTFVKALNLHLTDLREEYEDTEASEFNRGRVQAIKELINLLADQQIK